MCTLIPFMPLLLRKLITVLKKLTVTPKKSELLTVIPPLRLNMTINLNNVFAKMKMRISLVDSTVVHACLAMNSMKKPGTVR